MKTLDLILPHLAPIRHLIEDPTVSEIMVNGNERVFVERAGILAEEKVFILPATFETGIKNIAHQLGMKFDGQNPILDARLPTGERICAVWKTVALGGIPTLNIRKFQGWKTVEELVDAGSISSMEALAFGARVSLGRNILISGGVGTGKTTLLRALASLIPPGERIITIEDTAELQLDPRHTNVISLEAKRDLVSVRQLVKLAMRLRGDRLIVGETRGEEAWDLLKALNSGSSGSFSTIHADSPKQALEKIAMYALEANTGAPIEVINRSIGSSIHYVIQQSRLPGGKRGITQLMRVEGYEGKDFVTTSLYERGDDE